MVALAFEEVYPLSQNYIWPPNVLDKLIRAGDSVYKNSKRRRDSQLQNKPRRYLTLDEVNKHFLISGQGVHTERVNYDVAESYSISVDRLIKSFTKFFKKSNKGALCCNDHVISFFRCEDIKTHYIFDSHCRDQDGMNYIERNNEYVPTAALIRFNSLPDMAELIYRNLTGAPKSRGIGSLLEDEDSQIYFTMSSVVFRLA